MEHMYYEDQKTGKDVLLQDCGSCLVLQCHEGPEDEEVDGGVHK